MEREKGLEIAEMKFDGPKYCNIRGENMAQKSLRWNFMDQNTAIFAERAVKLYFEIFLEHCDKWHVVCVKLADISCSWQLR
jgi:hypothetical protein